MPKNDEKQRLWIQPDNVISVLDTLAEVDGIDENYRSGLMVAIDYIRDIPGYTRDEIIGVTQFFFANNGIVKCLVCRKEVSSRQFQHCPHCGRLFVGATNEEWEATQLRLQALKINETEKESEPIQIPYWEKANLTINEAASYFGIGQNKIRALTEVRNCNFVLLIGSKRLIKRKAFEKFLEAQHML